MSDLQIKSSLTDDYMNIEKDINDISTIITNIYNAMKTLDESKWKSNEKDKIDQEFIPYLSKISEKIPSNLRKKLDFARYALEKHEEQDNLNAKEVENEVSTTFVEKL